MKIPQKSGAVAARTDGQTDRAWKREQAASPATCFPVPQPVLCANGAVTQNSVILSPLVMRRPAAPHWRSLYLDRIVSGHFGGSADGHFLKQIRSRIRIGGAL